MGCLTSISIKEREGKVWEKWSFLEGHTVGLESSRGYYVKIEIYYEFLSTL